MNTAARPNPSILIASDNSTDAGLVKKLVEGVLDNVFTSTDAARGVEDFDRRQPQVLVLAFNTLANAERYCLGLYRLSSKIHSQPLRTVILCNKDELKQVSDLCLKQQSFDDYVLFWPLNHDAPRLRMTLHHALRELANLSNSGPSPAEFAAQARRLAELETLLDQQMALGGRSIEVANQAIEKAEHDIDAALHGFSQRLGQGGLPGVIDVRDAAGLDREIAGLRRDHINPPMRAAAESMKPLKRWVDEFKQECAPHLESARAMSVMAEQVRPTILVVDDDEFQHKMVARLLASEPCNLVFAASGAEALKVVGKSVPDLVLMDIQMPGMDGLEVTRRIKSVPHLAAIPVVMITGKSEGNIVVDSLKAGACDFVVKPFDREKLAAKVARWSRPKGAAASRTAPA